MKILIDARLYGLENTGIGRYQYNLIKELSNIDKENSYHILLRNKHFNELNLPENWEKHLADFRHYSLKEQIALPKLIKKIRPDVTHFPHFNVPVAYRGSYVVTIHDLSMHRRKGKDATTLSPLSYGIKRLGYKYVFNKALKNSRKIITVSEFVKSDIIRNYNIDDKKIEVVYNGIQPEFFRKKASSVILRREKIKDRYLVYAGNSYPHKNLKRAIEAVVMINETTEHDLSMVIVTARNIFKNRLKKEINAANADEYVKLLDYVTDAELHSLYKNSEGFIYPSTLEGFGMPGLEAMASGTLAIVSDIPVFKEVYGNNAVYFNPYDFSSISRKINEVLDMPGDRRKKLIEKGLKYAKKYSWEKAAKETLKVYENCNSL